MTGRHRLARTALPCAVLAALLLAFAAAPAAAQTVSITSTPANGRHYIAGEVIRTRLNISRTILIVGGTGNNSMALNIGGTTRYADCGRGGVNCSYTVVAADSDANGISIPANSITGPTWRDGVGLISRNHPALTDQAAHKVMGRDAAISSTTPAALTEENLNGATITVTLTGTTFASGVTTASFQLVTTMTGVTIDSVSSVSSGDTTATLTLSSTATLSADATLAVRVLGAAHSGSSSDLTTGTVTVSQYPPLSAGPGASTDVLSLSLDEGTSDSWTMVLASNPGTGCTAGVGIGITSDSPSVTLSPATLTFTTTNWSTAQTVTATAAEDGNLVDETATISHTVTAACASDYPTGLSIASVTVSVDDNDTALFSIDATARVAEGGAGDTPTLDFTVTLAPAASVQATVGYATGGSGDTAVAGTDYTATSGTLTFAAGETSKTVSVTVSGDTDIEPDETVRVTLSNPTPSDVVIATGMGTGIGTIADDDAPNTSCDGGSCTVTITSTPANGTHYVAGEAITTRIGRLGGNGITTTTPVAISMSRMALNIGGVARQASATTTIPPTGQREIDFSYTVTASDYDGDGISIPQNSISGTTWLSWIPEGGGFNITLNRDHAALPAQRAHQVIGYSASISSTTPAALTEGNLSGATIAIALTGVTFESGVTASSFELVTTMTGVSISSVSSVSSGDTAATLTLASTADISTTADLAVRVLAAAHSGIPDLTTGTVPVVPVLAVGTGASTSTLAVAVREGGMGTWSVVLNADPGSGCTGASSLTIAVASDDTAVATVSPATLTFTTANWSTAQTVTATGVADNDLADETATVSHTVTAACTGYPTTLAIASVRVAVEDDDTSLISVDAPRVLEGGVGDTPTMDFTVTLAPAAAVEATVDYSQALGGTAQSGTDFTAVAGGTLTFAPGETRKTVSVTVTGDTTQETDESVQLFFSNPMPSTVVVGTGSTYPLGSIVDDDTPTLRIDSPRGNEGDFGTAGLAFAVTLAPAASDTVTVDWADTEEGTASRRSDYGAPTGGTLTFAAGETRKLIPLGVRGDVEFEPDETVLVRIENATAATGMVRIRGADGSIAAQAFGTATIANDDSLEANRPPEVLEAPGAIALDPGGTAAIALTGAFRDPEGGPLTLSATSSRPAVATARLNGTTLALAAVAEGQTRITVYATDARGATASLSFLVTVGNPASIGGGGEAGDSLDVVVASAPEGGVAEVVVAMAAAREADVSFAYSFGPDGDAATADADAADHGGEGGTVTIPAGETEATINIPILDDDDIEPAREAFAVTLTPTSGAGVAVSSAIVHIAEGVCDRSWQVADALRDGRACEAVTPAELARRRTVRLADAGLAELHPLDFLGLGSLAVLILDGNGLSALPEGLLAGSPKLRVLRLRGNRFEALPALGSAPELIELDLAGNLLAELPAEALADLPALGYLYLGGNRIEALPADLLAEAEAMRILELQDNALEALPEGLFAGVAKLFSLQLQGNPGAPFALPVELDRVEPEDDGETGEGEAGAGAGEEPEEDPGRAEIQLRAPHGAPFAIEAAISAPGATLSAQIAAIAAGETLGDPVSVIRDVAGNEANAAVTVEITSTTSLPTTACGDEDDEYRCFRGFELTPGSPLTLFELPAAADVPTMR